MNPYLMQCGNGAIDKHGQPFPGDRWLLFNQQDVENRNYPECAPHTIIVKATGKPLQSSGKEPDAE